MFRRYLWLIIAALVLTDFFLLSAIIPWSGPGHHVLAQQNKVEYAADDQSEKHETLLTIEIGIARSVAQWIGRHKTVIEAFSVLMTMAFTGALAWFTVGLWSQTKRLAQDAERQYAIGNRAFVFLDTFVQELTTRADNMPDYSVDSEDGLVITRFAILPSWGNSGNTATKNLQVKIGWGNFTYLVGTYTADAAPLFVPPKATVLGEVIEMGTLGDVRAAAFSGREFPLTLIWGRADYEDIFGGQHFVEWCYRIRPHRHRPQEPLKMDFIQWGDYNRSGTK